MAMVVFLMRAVVDRVNDGARQGQRMAHPVMQPLYSGTRNEPFGHAALVADHNHTEACPIKQRDGMGRAGKKIHLLPAGHIFAFRSLPVDDAVTIQKHSFLHVFHERLPALPVRQECARSGWGTPECAALRWTAHRCSNRPATPFPQAFLPGSRSGPRCAAPFFSRPPARTAHWGSCRW